jgi:hypothetical protein
MKIHSIIFVQISTNFFYPCFLESSFDHICTCSYPFLVREPLTLFCFCEINYFFLHNLRGVNYEPNNNPKSDSKMDTLFLDSCKGWDVLISLKEKLKFMQVDTDSNYANILFSIVLVTKNCHCRKWRVFFFDKRKWKSYSLLWGYY